MLEIICFKNSNRNFGFIWLHFLEFCCCCHFEGGGVGGGGGGGGGGEIQNNLSSCFGNFSGTFEIRRKEPVPI